MKKIKKYTNFIKENLSIGPDGLIGDVNDMSNLEFTHEEEQEMFEQLKKKWNIKDGRTVTAYSKEYWFPLGAEQDLKDLGITWYEKDKVTNKEHKDYGKSFLVFSWIHSNLKDRR